MLDTRPWEGSDQQKQSPLAPLRICIALLVTLPRVPPGASLLWELKCRLWFSMTPRCILQRGGGAHPTRTPPPPVPAESERHGASRGPTYLVIHGTPSTWLHLDVWLGPEEKRMPSGLVLGDCWQGRRRALTMVRLWRREGQNHGLQTPHSCPIEWG